MYTSLRVAAWAAVGLLCLLCGCGSETQPSPYDRVASETRYERAMLPTQQTAQVELDNSLVDDICLYLQAAAERTALHQGASSALKIRRCRQWLQARSDVCQEALLSLYDCLGACEAQAKLAHPRVRPPIDLAACPVQASTADAVCAEEPDESID